MKLLFYHPQIAQRAVELSYDNMMSAGGFSGTETALLEVCRELCARNHEVTLCGSPRSFREPCGIRHVWSEHEMGADFDWFCPLFYTGECGRFLKKLDPARTRVLLWVHCFIGDAEFIQQGFEVCAQFVSEFVARQYSHIPIRKWTIGHAVSCSSKSVQKIPGRWVFAASYERGGAVARRVFAKVREASPAAATDLVFASYYTPDGGRSLSKRALAELVASAEFFVYPLVLQSGRVHHDTFACVVLEALAGSVDVVTWDAACLREVFGGDRVALVPPPACPGYDPRARFGCNPRMLTDDAVAALAAAVLAVAALPAGERERRRRAAAAWANGQTWMDKAGRMEAELLTA